jgi:hypothetical protein
MNLAAFWQQMLPSMPVLPVQPTHKHCTVNNLASDSYHGMEEVIDTRPIYCPDYFRGSLQLPVRAFARIEHKALQFLRREGQLYA